MATEDTGTWQPELPFQFHGRIEPPFYGTGDMLLWDAAELLNKCDKESLFKKYWHCHFSGNHTYEQQKETVYLPLFDAFFSEIVTESRLQVRGFYSFFPVITHNENLIFIDPGDFTQELAEFSFLRPQEKRGVCVSDFFRPEGDIIGLFAVTLGHGSRQDITFPFKKISSTTLTRLYTELQQFLLAYLQDRITLEITRSIDLPREQGTLVPIDAPGAFTRQDLPRFFQILGIEERLGVVLTETGEMNPISSTLQLLIHHEQGKNWMNL